MVSQVNETPPYRWDNRCKWNYFSCISVRYDGFALGSGYPVAFSLPGAAIISILAAGLVGFLLEGEADALIFI